MISAFFVHSNGAVELPVTSALGKVQARLSENSCRLSLRFDFVDVAVQYHSQK